MSDKKRIVIIGAPLMRLSVSIIITLITFYLFISIHEYNFDFLVKAAYGVIERRPHWLAYQNRILGPYLILAISQLGVTYASAFKIYIFSTLLFEILLLQSIARTTLKVGEVETIIIIVIYCASFLFFQDFWFYLGIVSISYSLHY